MKRKGKRQQRLHKERLIKQLIRASRKVLRERKRKNIPPAHLKKIWKLAMCKSCQQAKGVIQRGGLPFLPLLIAALPAIAKGALSIGAGAAASAAGSAIAKAINKKDEK